MKRFGIWVFAILLSMLSSGIASAHEVYILDAPTILRDVRTISPNPFEAYLTNQGRFFFWGFIAFVTVSTIFCMSLFGIFERWANPYLVRIKRYAPLVERVTLGLSLLVFAYVHALFGPELPLVGIYGVSAPIVTTLLYATGILVLLGLFTRAAALTFLLIALYSIAVHGVYMFMYTAYFVVAIVLFVVGGGVYSLDYLWREEKGFIASFKKWFEPYEMLSLRIGFGVSIIAAAVYAKFLHTNLALDVIHIYHLTNYFQFDPLFVVLGAFIIECLIGIFIILGIEIRWTALFFLFWLMLSLLYFGEAAWPHLALFGFNIMLFFHGYDAYTLQGRFFKKYRFFEPFL